MSESYHIGLSKHQILELLNGETVGKRPYYKDIRYKGKFNDTVRVYVKMLTEEEQKQEPVTAFGW